MKVEFRNREILEAEGAMQKLIDIEMNQKMAYALAKNQRIIGNEAQDLKAVIQMDKEKYQSAMLFEEKRQLILEDSKIPSDDRAKMITDLEAKFPDARYAINNQQRETNETLNQTVELELHEIKYEWLPEKFPGGALGPMVAIVTMEEDKD